MTDDYDPKIAHPESQVILNRLLAIEEYSLANYLLYAPPWTHPGDEPLIEAVRRIAADQQAEAVRIGQLLVRRYGYAESSQFPVQFTAFDDVALDYLLKPLIEQEGLMIDAIMECAQQLAGDPEAKHLAEEAIAGAKQHLDLLTRLAASHGEQKATVLQPA